MTFYSGVVVIGVGRKCLILAQTDPHHRRQMLRWTFCFASCSLFCFLFAVPSCSLLFAAVPCCSLLFAAVVPVCCCYAVVLREKAKQHAENALQPKDRISLWGRVCNRESPVLCCPAQPQKI